MVGWGMPSPAFALVGKKADTGVTNVRNTASPHWHRWLTPEHRCLVPWTAFSEPERGPDGEAHPVWFAREDDRTLAFFAGIWTPAWKSARKVKEGEVTADLFAFLISEPTFRSSYIPPGGAAWLSRRPTMIPPRRRTASLHSWVRIVGPGINASPRPLPSRSREPAAQRTFVF